MYGCKHSLSQLPTLRSALLGGSTTTVTNTGEGGKGAGSNKGNGKGKAKNKGHEQNPVPKAKGKAKDPSKHALDLVARGALKIVDADSLFQQCITANVKPDRIAWDWNFQFVSSNIFGVGGSDGFVR